MDLETEFYRVTSALSDARIDYALCGGLAVIVHGYPRLTRDIDILVLEQDLERSLNAVAGIGYDLESGRIPFDTGMPTERAVFRVTRAEGNDFLTLDFILVSSFLEDVWMDREKRIVDGRTVTVVSREGLAKMKRAAGRPQDLTDLSQLGLDEPTND